MAAAIQTALGLILVAFWLGRDLHSAHVAAVTSSIGVAVPVLGIGALVIFAVRSRSNRLQALLLGAAAGSAYGLSDALARAVQVTYITGFSNLVEVLAGATALVAGGTGLLLTQTALQKGRVSALLPAQDLLALLVSIALGATLLGEAPPLTRPLLLGTLFALVLTGHGILQLSRAVQQAATPQELSSKSRDLIAAHW